MPKREPQRWSDQPLIRRRMASRTKELRESRRLTQEDIAKVLQLHREAITLIERGQRRLTAEELWSLSVFYGVSMDWFVEGVETPRHLSGRALYLAQRLIEELQAECLAGEEDHV